MTTLKQSLDLILSEDAELYAQLCEAELIPRDERELSAEHLEIARVTRTLVRELEVNWAGVEVVLQMRSQLIATRRQLDELAAVVRRSQDKPREP